MSADHAAPGDARDLLAYLAASPSPYHAAEEAARRLVEVGFTRLDEAEPWPTGPGAHLVVRGGALVAWVSGGADDPPRRFRVVGAHTDSPNLRIKPRPDTGAVGVRQLGVEVYGGALWNSWLDRDLGLSGRVAVRDGSDAGVALRPVRVERPLLRVPQLAIHLDRNVNGEGLKLNAQQHLAPMWGLGAPDEGGFRRFLADELDVAAADVVGWDVMAHDLAPPALAGRDEELVSSARIDDQLSCWAALAALARLGPTPAGTGTVPVVCLFDHEEIGSQSASGADSSILPTVLERIVLAAGGGREDLHRALAGSLCLSADGAHATNPNYVDRHEPAHRIALDGGPVLKHNANVRYATDAAGAAEVRVAAEAAGVPLQEFVVRTDMPCGSTIGPVTAARLGITTVDVGVAQLAMHSARELCGRTDAERFVPLLGAFLAPDA